MLLNGIARDPSTDSKVTATGVSVCLSWYFLVKSTVITMNLLPLIQNGGWIEIIQYGHYELFEHWLQLGTKTKNRTNKWHAPQLISITWPQNQMLYIRALDHFRAQILRITLRELTVDTFYWDCEFVIYYNIKFLWTTVIETYCKLLACYSWSWSKIRITYLARKVNMAQQAMKIVSREVTTYINRYWRYSPSPLSIRQLMDFGKLK